MGADQHNEQNFGDRLAKVCASKTLQWDVDDLTIKHNLLDREELYGVAKKILPEFPKYLEQHTQIKGQSIDRFIEVFHLLIVHAPLDEVQYSGAITALVEKFNVTPARVDRMMRDSAKYFYRFLEQKLIQRKKDGKNTGNTGK